MYHLNIEAHFFAKKFPSKILSSILKYFREGLLDCKNNSMNMLKHFESKELSCNFKFELSLRTFMKIRQETMSNNLCHNDTNHCNIHQGHLLVLAAYQVQLLTKREIFHAAFYNSNMLKLEWSPS